MALKALKGQPEGFNGPAGFLLFQWLNDADRNALLCASGALSQSTMNMMAGDADKAKNLIHLSQTSLDASSLLYTVSENVGSLYQRYVEAEEQLEKQGFETAQRYMDILKKKGVTPKK